MKNNNNIDKNKKISLNDDVTSKGARSLKTEETEPKTNKENAVKNITKRSEDYSQWYQDVIAAADLAEHSVVRGCMVIKPCGYAI